MAFSVVTVVTNTAKQKISEMILNGKGFKIIEFETGEGGHDPLNSNLALTPDPTLTELPSKTFGPKAIEDAVIDSFNVAITVKLEESEAIGNMSNLGLIAEIVSSPTVGDPDIGTKFLFSIGNMPLRPKLDSEELEFLLTILY